MEKTYFSITAGKIFQGVQVNWKIDHEIVRKKKERNKKEKENDGLTFQSTMIGRCFLFKRIDTSSVG